MDEPRRDRLVLAIVLGIAFLVVWSAVFIFRGYFEMRAGWPRVVYLPLVLPIALMVVGLIAGAMIVVRGKPNGRVRGRFPLSILRLSLVLGAATSFAYLILSAFVQADQIARWSQLPQEGLHTLISGLHWLTILMFALFGGVAFVSRERLTVRVGLWQKFTGMYGKVMAANPWYRARRPTSKEAMFEIQGHIRSALRGLHSTLQQNSDNYIIKRRRSIPGLDRVASIWVPHPSDSRFVCLAWWPGNLREINEMMTSYSPAMYDEEGFHRVQRSLIDLLDPSSVIEYQEAKAKVVSLCGALWAGLGPASAGEGQPSRVYVRDSQDYPADHPFFDHTYRRTPGSVEMRSQYLRLLSAGDRKLGLLVVLDPMPLGIAPTDIGFLEAYATLLEQLLSRYFFLVAPEASHVGRLVAG